MAMGVLFELGLPTLIVCGNPKAYDAYFIEQN